MRYRICPTCSTKLFRRRIQVKNRVHKLELWRCEPCNLWLRRSETAWYGITASLTRSTVSDKTLEIQEIYRNLITPEEIAALLEWHQQNGRVLENEVGYEFSAK